MTNCSYCRLPISAQPLPGRAWTDASPAVYCCYGCLSLGEVAAERGQARDGVAPRLDPIWWKLGLSVLLIEKRQEIGSPVRCAEGLTPGALSRFIDADPKWISAYVCKARIIVVREGREYAWHSADTIPNEAASGVGQVVERRVFDRALAEKAVAAGARVILKTGPSQGYSNMETRSPAAILGARGALGQSPPRS